jgi:hypothetical protein
MNAFLIFLISALFFAVALFAFVELRCRNHKPRKSRRNDPEAAIRTTKGRKIQQRSRNQPQSINDSPSPPPRAYSPSESERNQQRQADGEANPISEPDAARLHHEYRAQQAATQTPLARRPPSIQATPTTSSTSSSRTSSSITTTTTTTTATLSPPHSVAAAPLEEREDDPTGRLTRMNLLYIEEGGLGRGNTMDETDENGYVTFERLKNCEGEGDEVGRRGEGDIMNETDETNKHVTSERLMDWDGDGVGGGCFGDGVEMGLGIGIRDEGREVIREVQG